MLPNFPHFAPLNLEDKDSYNELIAEFPPHSDISFTTLHIWWNLEKQLSISSLKGNVVINYHLPHDQENSGYSLIGKHLIDNSIATILEYLRKQHSTVRLVHVPEFVVDKIKHKDLLNLKEELDYNEYILDSHSAATLEGGKYASTRKKINRFLKQVKGKKIETKSLNLSSTDSINQLLHSIQEWEKKKPWKNDPDRTEYQAIKKTLEHASILDVQNLAFYIDGRLCAVLLYHKSIDKKYYTMHHLKVDHSLIYIVDYIEQVIAKKAVEENVPFINLEMDLGIEGLREHKIGLKPVDFFRKYTITPANG
jgi:hypothetical protein